MVNFIFKKLFIKSVTIFFNAFFLQKYKVKYSNMLSKNLTIISNNCFAGNIYQLSGREYLTPTVGLFIYPSCYNKFVSNIKHYLTCDIEFVEFSKYCRSDDEVINYPIGILDDIEVHFLHYSSIFEAKVKWNKRKSRVNFDNIVYIFSNADGFDDHAYDFYMKFSKQKFLFASNKKFFNPKNTIPILFSNKIGDIYDITTNRWLFLLSDKYQEIVEPIFFARSN